MVCFLKLAPDCTKLIFRLKTFPGVPLIFSQGKPLLATNTPGILTPAPAYLFFFFFFFFFWPSSYILCVSVDITTMC